MIVQDKSTVFIQNSTFSNLGSDLLIKGAGLSVFNSNLTLLDVEFSYNKAGHGSAVSLNWDKKIKWSYNISNCSFLNNIAFTFGAGIYYDLYKPYLSDNIFFNNSASYGSNIASYPVKIKIKESQSDEIILKNVGSGVTYDQTLEFSLVDQNEQIMVLDNSSQIEIKAIQSSSSVEGFPTAKVANGVATFTNLIFVSNPGDDNIQFEITSKSIDPEKLKLEFGSDYKQESIDVSFRYCQPGEKVILNKCSSCSAGSYSFIWNSTECETWMDSTEWQGGIEVYVDKGYWRNNKNSTKVYQWLREESCKGGYNANNKHPVNWATGYEGILCAQCSIAEDRKYENVGNYQWAKWPNVILNAIRVIGLILLVWVYMTALVSMMLRKKEESQRSILMRIVTNYLQVITAVLSYNINFPSTMKDILSSSDLVGSSSEPFVSFDWFARNNKLDLFTPSPGFFKAFLSALLPLFSIILSFWIWSIIYLLFKKWIKDLKRNILVTNIVILFILHPNITRTFVTVFQWIEVEENDYRVTIALNMKWFSAEHMLWLSVLVLPCILIWSIGIPLWAFIILYKNKDNLEQPQIQSYYLMIYQGLKPNRFYWEFWNTGRKIIILWVNIFLSTQSINYRLLTIITLLTIFYRIQLTLEPYKEKVNNKLEQLELSKHYL